MLANTLPGHGPRNDLDNDTYIPDVVGTPLTVIQNATRGKARNGLGITESDTMYTLDVGSQHAVGVRRLTPTECARLQGFPDDWCVLDEKTPDGPQYKAYGNAVTVPVIEYLGIRIREVL